MSPETETRIVLGQPFGYTKQDITDGLVRTRTTLDEYQKLKLTKPDDRYINSVIIRYSAVIAYADATTPADILKTLRKLHSEVLILEQSGTEGVEIGRIINENHPGLTRTLRDIVHKGWIEPLFQKTVAAALLDNAAP